MNKRSLICWIILFAHGLSLYAQNAQSIAHFDKDTFFIEGRAQISPDGKYIALQARDKPNLYTNKAHLWLGTIQGNFKKIIDQRVSNIQWINDHEIAFQDAEAAVNQFWLKNAPKPRILINAMDISTLKLRKLYEREIKQIPGSGGIYETINLIHISSTGRYLLMQDTGGFFLQDTLNKKRFDLKDFRYSFSGFSYFDFNKNDSLACYFDSTKNTYQLYSLDQNGLKPRESYNRQSLANHSPSGYFRWASDDKGLIFASEVCKGNCFYEIYFLNLQDKSLDLKTTVTDGKILSLTWTPDLSSILYNQGHLNLMLQKM